MGEFPVDLSARVAIVTGGASGIGRATAELLASCGAAVYVADFQPLVENEQRFEQLGIQQRKCDVRREADVAEWIGYVARAGRGLDILVNNAGIGLVKQIPDVTEQEWDACLDTNLKAAFLTAKHAIPHLKARGGGSIVNVASNAGILPRAHDPVYSTSKGALVAFTRSLALCHAPDRIRVNAVCPGPVGQTRMMENDLQSAGERRAELARSLIDASPLARAHGRMIDPAEVAQAVLYLTSDASAMVTGTMIAIDGGKSLGVPPRAK